MNLHFVFGVFLLCTDAKKVINLKRNILQFEHDVKSIRDILEDKSGATQPSSLDDNNIVQPVPDSVIVQPVQDSVIVPPVQDPVAIDEDKVKTKFERLSSRLRQKREKEGCNPKTHVHTELREQLQKLAEELIDVANRSCTAESAEVEVKVVTQKRAGPSPTCSEASNAFECGFCLHQMDLGPKFFPRYINTEKCLSGGSSRTCVYGSGKCVQGYFYMPIYRDDKNVGRKKLNQWTSTQLAIEDGCKCEMKKNNPVEILLNDICQGSDFCSLPLGKR